MPKNPKNGLPLNNTAANVTNKTTVALPTFVVQAIVFIVLSVFSYPVAAQELSLIRDAETEAVLKSYVKPMFNLCGIPSDTLQIVLVKDNSINAFATTRFTIFVNTGLITSSNNVDEVIGVLAHETGHISGGHLVRLASNMKILSAGSLISTVLGTAAAIVTGRPDVGAAVMMGGTNAAMQSYLSYRQGEENAADETAAKILKNTGYSAEGFLKVMNRLIAQEKIALSQDASSYLRTHPVTQDRAEFLNNVIKTQGSSFPSHTAQEESFEMIKAKLIGFLYPPFKVQMIYPAYDKSSAARYARAISDFRNGRLNEALSGIDALIKEKPNNPYLYELKGQFLFENGRISDSIPLYEKSVKLAKDEPLIRLALAYAYVEADSSLYNKKAIKNLEQILQKERSNSAAWRLLAIAAGREEDAGLTYYAMAEYNYALGNYADASFYAKKAKIELKPNTPRYIRLTDLMVDVEKQILQTED